MVTTSDKGAPRAKAKSDAMERTEGISVCEVDIRTRDFNQEDMVAMRRVLAGFSELVNNLPEGRFRLPGWERKA